MKTITNCILALAVVASMAGAALADDNTSSTTGSVDHCKDAASDQVTTIEYDVATGREVRTFTGVTTPCVRITANVYDDTPTTPASTAYDPNRDNELLGIMEDAVAGVNDLNGRVSDLEARKTLAGPRGPRGESGGVRFRIGPTLSLVTDFAGQPIFGGGLVAEIGGEKVWASYHGTVGSDGVHGQVGTNLHNSLAAMFRVSDKLAFGIGGVDSRFLYFAKAESGKQRTASSFWGFGPQIQVTLEDRFLLNLSGAYGQVASEATGMVVKKSAGELSLGFSVLLN